MSRFDVNDAEESIIYMAPCGDAIELWEPIPRLTAWCDTCREYHVYLPE